jgi:type I restriction-modification system DNA methylase subunit
MIDPRKIEEALARVTDQESFLQTLLAETLGWPLREKTKEVKDASFEWTAEELRASGLDKHIVENRIWQLRRFDDNQSWGVFIIEFKNDSVFTKGRGLTGPLRKILRGLVPNARRRSDLPAWTRENLLFICTHNYQHYCFAYFKVPKDSKLAPLSTFGWEKGDTSIHTLCEYNLSNLVWSDDLQQSQWRTAFDLEKVTKGFFSKIAELFTKLAGGKRGARKNTLDAGKGLLEFPSPDETVKKNFAVRLIGRLVFCWFLKKKRSKQGVNLLPEELISTEAVNKNKGYYHNVLEPLFFEVLNTRMDERAKDYVTKLWATIPFLNGGLFTPNKEDDFYETYLPGISKYINTLKVPDEWLRDLLNVFETYNFTIDENTPVDVEMAIEPEMLGRIFENLLAEINPETGETARKATGSYYTPRPIVEYMVDESIKQYLLTKTKLPEEKISALLSYAQEAPDLTDAQKDEVLDALDTVKVIDPACGSGAFPMGILQKILLILRKMDPDSKKWLGRKLSRIDDATFKKDLERKLKRESLEYVHKLGIIRDAIYGVDIQSIAVEISKLRCFLSLIVDETIDDTQPNRGVEPLPNLEFKFVCANTLIGLGGDMLLTTEATKKITELKQVREEYLNSYGKEKKELENKFLSIRSELSRLALNWQKGNEKALKLAEWDPFSHESCSWFDPDWMFGIKGGFDIVIANPPYIDSESMVKIGQIETREAISKEYKMTKGNWDIYIAFFELGFTVLNTNGILTFITPDKWSSKPFGDTLRKNKINNLSSVLKAGRKVFESSKVDSIVSFFTMKPCHEIRVFNYENSQIAFKREVNKSILKTPFAFDFLFSDYLELLMKLDGITETISDSFNCENACATSDAYKLKPLIRDLTNKSFNQNHELKIINTGTIDKYVSKWGVRAMTYLGDKYLCPVVNKKDFSHLFKNTYAEKAMKPKIIMKGLNLLDACLDFDGSIIPGKTTLIVVGNNATDLKLLLPIINSKLALFYLKEKYPASSYNEGVTFTREMINNLPCPKSLKIEQKNVLEIVEQIFAVAQSKDYFENSAKQAEVKKLENQIDQMVYKIYGLTADEITIVEGQSKKD